MLVWFAVAAVGIVLLARCVPPRRRPVRLLPGDRVMTPDGLLGTVSEHAGARTLVDLGAAQLWLPTRLLDDPPTPGVAHNDNMAHEICQPGGGEGGGGALGRAVFGRRRAVLVLWAAALACSLPLVATVGDILEPGGFQVRGGAAEQVAEQVGDRFDLPRSTATVLLSTEAVAPADAMAARDALREVEHVRDVSEVRRSPSGQLLAITLGFDVREQQAVEPLERARSLLAKRLDIPRSQVRMAGTAATAADTSSRAQRDLRHAEAIGIPAALLVLLLVCRSLVAAAVPLVVGVASVLLSLALVALVGTQAPVSVFAMNIASMLGLGLGIDYSLLGVTRFREALARGTPVGDAVTETVASAGRATLVSGLAVGAGMSALAVVPLGVMSSIAIGGVVVVAVSILASLTLLPALLGVLGHRVNLLGVAPRTAVEPSTSGWYRFAHRVMRHPGLAIAGGGLVLALLASPIRTHALEIPHEEVLPASSPSRATARLLEREFGQRVVAPTFVVAETTDTAKLEHLHEQLLGIPHVVDAEPVASAGGATLLRVNGDTTAATGGPAARQLADRVDALDGDRVRVRVGGVAAGEREFLSAMADGIPTVLAIVLLSTFVVLCASFRSIALPLKALALDTLSIGAAFGTVLLVFADGHWPARALGVEALGYADATLPLILFCVLFGLSMDYEVFMLARITELYQRGHDHREATARGLAATAPLVSGAALILVVIGLSFALTDLVLVQELGFGMAAALALDATVVRFVLLPATMALLGARNWWVPGWLAPRIPRLEWAH